MQIKNWIKDIFLTEAQLVTGRRFIKWRQIAITSGSVAFIFMIIFAVFGETKGQPNSANYQSLSSEDMNKHGVMILSQKTTAPSAFKRAFNSPSSGIAAGNEQAQVITRKDRAHAEYVLPAGSKINVALDGELNSELSQSPVTALLSNAFSFQSKVLLPAGTKVLGHVGRGQDSDRIAVSFDQFVLPNGHQVSAQGAAIMPDSSPGIVGQFHSNKAWKIAGALGSSFLAGAASAFQSTQANGFGIQQPEGTTRNAILNGVAQTTLDQGKRFSDDAQSNPGYVTASAGTTFIVFIEKETDLSGAIQ